jgi:hypothetical protein
MGRASKVEGVEPTNNFMERLVRLAVLWRRRSFGCNSDSGCRFVERILTVIQTCRLNKNNPLEDLAQAVHARRIGQAYPKTPLRGMNGYGFVFDFAIVLLQLVQVIRQVPSSIPPVAVQWLSSEL